MPKPKTGLARRVRDVALREAAAFFRLSGSREKAARGFAVGLACNFFPTFGLGAFLSGFLARLFGGNVVAGFIGGSLLAVFWPLLFYLNMRVGSFFVRPPIVIDDLEDVTVSNMCALAWGQTFAVGAVLNGAVAAALAYLGFLVLYQRLRPAALGWIRGRLRRRRTLHSAEARETD